MHQHEENVDNLLLFLSHLHENGLSYSSLNVARSAVSQFLAFGNSSDSTMGEHKLVKRFFKGIYRMKPPAPRYVETWDVSKVLHYLGTALKDNHGISLKDLSLKTVALLALLSGQRCQTIHQIKIDNIHFEENTVVIIIDGMIKQSRPGTPNPILEFEIFAENRAICVVECLKTYLSRTEGLRKSEKLLLSYIKPHNPISKDSVSRWVKVVLERSGIDTVIFKAHSTRSASTSRAKESGVPLQTILDTAGWAGARTFHRFYQRQLERKGERRACRDFATTIQTTNQTPQ
jgi:integrase